MLYEEQQRYIINRRLGKIARNIRLSGISINWQLVKEYIDYDSYLTLQGINKLVLIPNKNKYLLCLALRKKRGFSPVCFLTD
jgi:uncharacterized protein with PIN domain